MTKTKYAPGPWKINGRSIDNCNGEIAATTEYEANARLIAAAPQMHAFVEEVAHHLYTKQDMTRCIEMAKYLLRQIAGEQ